VNVPYARRFVGVVEGAVDASASKLDAAAADISSSSSSSSAAAAGGSVGFEYRVLWNRAGQPALLVPPKHPP
jgi:hypothetical protein